MEKEKQIKTIYDLEADELTGEELKAKKDPSLFWLLFRASGIFLFVTLVVFSIANYQFIKSQLIDWRREGDGETVGDFVIDADGDGMPDWWEVKNGLDPFNPNDAYEDLDNDYANNLMEYQYGTDPADPDTDGDGYFDGEEIVKGYNPRGVGWLDSDKDGMPDWWENMYGLDPNNSTDSGDDIDNDGLTNLEEFLFRTNPRKRDTNGDGYTDGEKVIKGYHPLGRGLLANHSFNLILKDEDGDGLEIDHENFFGTDPANPDTDGDEMNDFQELLVGRNPLGGGNIKATVEIPNIGVTAPIIWSQSEDEKEIQKDLNMGVIHYPGTPIPGMRGNTYITGHSSHYAWNNSPFKEIFKNLDKIKVGDQIIFHLQISENKNVEVIYEIELSEVVLPDDHRLFRGYEGHELTLVTCWPLGTDWKRLMLKGKMISPNIR